MQDDTTLAELTRLATVDNFRDVAGTGAGYAVPGGRMRRGLTYRSNQLERAGEDLATFAALGITAVHDLRSEREVERQPDPEVPGARWVHHPVRGTALTGTSELASAAETHAAMIGGYRNYVSGERNRAGFGGLLRELADSPEPALFHCAAGKDRTGWAAALLQHVAGLDRDTTVADYLLTAEYAAAGLAAAERWIADRMGADRLEVLRPSLQTLPEYLEAGFAEATARYGGLDGYLTAGLGLSDAHLAALRARLVA